MFGIFSRRDVRVQAAVTQGMQLKTIRDTGGYEFGVIWEPTLRQGSVLLKGEESFTLADIAMWRDLICTIEGVQVIATIWSAYSNIETHIPRMLVTFDAGGRKCDDFLTWLAKRLVYVYSPDQMELMWWPQEAEKVKEYASALWSPDSKPKFPPIAELLKERHSAIQCDSAYRLAFEVLLTASMSEDIVQEFEQLVLSSELRDGEEIHFVELLRPTDPIYLEYHEDAQRYRLDGVVVISSTSHDQCEDFATDLVNSLSAHARVRLTRLFGRQHIGVLLAGGLPAYGWQHNEVFVTKE